MYYTVQYIPKLHLNADCTNSSHAPKIAAAAAPLELTLLRRIRTDTELGDILFSHLQDAVNLTPGSQHPDWRLWKVPEEASRHTLSLTSAD